jgi:hypothetical protein
MKGAPPLVEIIFNLCPICVIAMPLMTIFVLIKLMKKPTQAEMINPDPVESDEVEPQ